MRILIWHGWLLHGSGSNVATARLCEVFRAAGHDVLLLCQEPHAERYPWIDASGALDREGPGELTPNPTAGAASGRCVLLRPRIGPTLPVFVLDPYEGFADVRRFVDLLEAELDVYLDRNVEALRAAATMHRPDATFVGHVIPGAALGRRALGPDRYVVKVHGSDLEYAIRPQQRYRELAREGLVTARSVVAASRDALDRCAELVPDMAATTHVVPPGVDVAAFRPMPRDQALLKVAFDLAADPDARRGRPDDVDRRLQPIVEAREAPALEALGTTYEQEVPDPGAAARLRRLAERPEPIVGYLGKLIPQKGVEVLLHALARVRHDVHGLIVGFGSGREPLEALAAAIRSGDREAVTWLGEAFGLTVDPDAVADRPAAPVGFTGMLDHRYAPAALAAMDVQVVPSILSEAFGMVAAEGAAAGALPLVARHSGLAEVAGALEEAVGRPGLFSFEPGHGASERLAAGIDHLLSLPAEERQELRAAVSAFVAGHWTWDRAAERLLRAADAG